MRKRALDDERRQFGGSIQHPGPKAPGNRPRRSEDPSLAYALSMAGMVIATARYPPPVAGAITQEVIDIAAVLNALRVTLPTKDLRDEGI